MVRIYVRLTFAKHEENTHEDERVRPDGKLTVFFNKNG